VTGKAAEELRELQEDAGTTDVPGSTTGHSVARVDSASSIRAGTKARLWIDTDKVHLFDPADGTSLTSA
jgi:multiple sugar transport system ATP-binding protein